jgi:hypothetical protein
MRTFARTPIESPLCDDVSNGRKQRGPQGIIFPAKGQWSQITLSAEIGIEEKSSSFLRFDDDTARVLAGFAPLSP